MEQKAESRLHSRRGILGYGAGVLLTVIAFLWGRRGGAPLLPGELAKGEARWYEVVQDMKQEEGWHINLYSAPVRGDLHQGKLREHRVVYARNIASVKAQLEYPARIQYRDGRQEDEL